MDDPDGARASAGAQDDLALGGTGGVEEALDLQARVDVRVRAVAVLGNPLGVEGLEAGGRDDRPDLELDLSCHASSGRSRPPRRPRRTARIPSRRRSRGTARRRAAPPARSAAVRPSAKSRGVGTRRTPGACGSRWAPSRGLASTSALSTTGSFASKPAPSSLPGLQPAIDHEGGPLSPPDRVRDVERAGHDVAGSEDVGHVGLKRFRVDLDRSVRAATAAGRAPSPRASARPR